MRERVEAMPTIIDNLRRVFHALNEYAKSVDEVTGLTGTQLWAIKLLAHTAPTRSSDLARQMYLHPATIVGVIDKLAAKGMVTRTRSLEDRRVVYIDLSSRGREVVITAPDVALGMMMEGLQQLSDEQFVRVAEGMELVARMLGAEHNIPHPLHST